MGGLGFKGGGYRVLRGGYWDNHPVPGPDETLAFVWVSWEEAKVFIQQLSKKTGKKYRLLIWVRGKRNGNTRQEEGNSQKITSMQEVIT